MELVCEKYKEKMDSRVAECRHPQEYCKFRSACLIQFMARESGRQRQEPAAAAKGSDHSSGNES